MSYQLRPTQPQQQKQREEDGGQDEYNTYSTDGYGQQAYTHAQPGQQPEMMQIQPQLPSPVAYPATPFYHDRSSRTQTWASNQPSAISPTTMGNTPLSEWAGSPFDYHVPGGYSPTMPPQNKKQGARVCGLPRGLFFIVLAIGLFGLVVAIAVGLGVGLGARSNTISDFPAESLSGMSSSSYLSPTPTTPTATVPTTPTKVAPTPSFTGTLITGLILCPENNNTVYVSEGTSKPFNIQCGRDYNSDRGAEDITNIETSNMADCINACGEREGCVGVGWGYTYGSYQCWLKSKLGEPNSSPPWYFAQLQNMTLAY
ncbi:uncharacterized protein F4822DRAFT_432923 [Hypoxylon trugodes]|uniref:uncharacterized protein n=1 Tax=Hypoxylon trugodes TaxID=326681 RepID=UPI00219B85BB|nr:uncharacterized protein F4822DRAFT_432923 [Hypoxylon trugodes]KAI1384376.1 hypothetical protein F4822DRAFT_432923 [Hypoxylon trugodes]